MSDLSDRNFSNETGEFLFELSLSNVITIFECDIQLNANLLTQYKTMLKTGPSLPVGQAALNSSNSANDNTAKDPSGSSKSSSKAGGSRSGSGAGSELLSLETNCFTFGAFDWSLTIVPLVVPSQQQQQPVDVHSSASSSSSNNNLLSSTPVKQLLGSKRGSLNSSGGGVSLNSAGQQYSKLEPVCRVYLNRLNGSDCLCRVKYRVILGHHQSASGNNNPTPPQPSSEFVDSKLLDQISDSGGRIRGHQFKNTNILKLISFKSSSTSSSAGSSSAANGHGHLHHQPTASGKAQHSSSANSSLDLRVHIEMVCANTISEARVPISRKPNELPASNCSDRNKQVNS